MKVVVQRLLAMPSWKRHISTSGSWTRGFTLWRSLWNFGQARRSNQHLRVPARLRVFHTGIGVDAPVLTAIMLPTFIRRATSKAAATTPRALGPDAITYKAKRTWPPDFEKLSPKHQFRLERKYKRRAQLKWARPKLMAATRVAQWAGGAFVLTYGVLFMDWGDEGAFKDIRDWYKETVNGFWTPRNHQRQPPT